METQKIQIPDGCKEISIEKVNNTVVIVFEPEKYVPEAGDYFRCGTITGAYAIAKAELCSNGSVDGTTRIHSDSKSILASFMYSAKDRTFTKLTESEFIKQAKEWGFDYNVQKNEFSRTKWKPKQGDKVYFVSWRNEISSFYYTHEDDYVLPFMYPTAEAAKARKKYNSKFIEP